MSWFISLFYSSLTACLCALFVIYSCSNWLINQLFYQEQNKTETESTFLIISDHFSHFRCRNTKHLLISSSHMWGFDAFLSYLILNWNYLGLAVDWTKQAICWNCFGLWEIRTGIFTVFWYFIDYEKNNHQIT